MKIRPGGKACSQAGFSFLEVMISLALLVLISSFLFASIGTGRRAWEAGQRMSTANQLPAARAYIRRRLRSAELTYEQTNAGPFKPYFSGDSASVRFAASVEQHGAIGGVYRIHLHQKREGAGQVNLMVSETLFRPLVQARHGEGHQGRHVQSVIERVAAVRFRYFGSSFPGTPPRWFDTWPGDRGLPTLVELEITFPEGDTRRWPTITIAPALTTH